MLKNLKNKKKKGFTLIELIIVIAIIAILAAIAVPKFGDVRRNAALKSDVANAKIIADGTSALIAEGTIEIPNEDITVVISGENTANGNVATSIEGYLQNVPTPKTSGYDNYKVKITEEGNVFVYMSGEEITTDMELYPTIPQNE